MVLLLSNVDLFGSFYKERVEYNTLLVSFIEDLILTLRVPLDKGGIYLNTVQYN